MIFCLISNVSECMIVCFVILQIPVDRPLKPGQFSLNTMNVKCILSQKYIGAHRVPSFLRQITNNKQQIYSIPLGKLVNY